MTRFNKNIGFRRIVGILLAFVLVVGSYSCLQWYQEASGTTNEATTSETVETQEADVQLLNEDDSAGDEGLEETPAPVAEEPAAGTDAEEVVVEAPSAPDAEDEEAVAVSVADEGTATDAEQTEKAEEEEPAEPVDPTVIEGNGSLENAYGEIKAGATFTGDVTYTSGAGTLTINGVLVGNIYVKGDSAPTIIVSKEGHFNGDLFLSGGQKTTLVVDGTMNGKITVTAGAPTISVGSNGTLTGSIDIQGSQKTTIVVDGTMNGNVASRGAGGNLDMTINGKLEGSTVSLESVNGTIAVKGTMAGNLTTAGSVLKLTVDGYLNGQIKETKDSRLTIYGNGTIGSKDATVNGSVINVIASKLSIEGNVTIQGGTGSKFEYTEKTKKQYSGAEYQGSGWYFHLVNGGIDQSMTFGGGILVQRDGEDGTKGSALYMKNGTVKGNTASAGGGILIDQFCDFIMDNGVIDSNKASNAEGGGIYLLKEGIATINAGSIINNRTSTVRDWGGGGIFVQSQRTLTFGGAATITKNIAHGLGGGLSGCPHAAMGVGEITNGFAIYDNTAEGVSPNFGAPEGSPSRNTFLWVNLGVGDKLFFNDNNNGTYGLNSYGSSAFTADRLAIRKANSQDYYCVKNTNVFGQQLGESDGNVAFKGVAFTSAGKAYKSTDKNASTGETIISGSPTKAEEFELKNGEWLRATNASIGLTAVKQPNQSADRPILISGNYSNTHGGGIGCNGGLVMGSLPDVVTESSAWSIEFDKQLLGLSGNPQDMEAGQFTFELYDEARGTVVATASNGEYDAESKLSKVKFNVSDPHYAGSANGEIYNFIIREVPVDGYVAQASVLVEVKVEKKTVKYENDADTVFQGRTVVKSQVVDGYPRFNGSESKNDLVFTNKMKPIEITWAPTATKYFFGNGTAEFTFNMYALANPGDESSIASLIADVDPVVGTASVASGSSAAITIPEQTITSEATGTHWYALTEAGDDPQDPTTYIYEVVVDLNDDNTDLNVSSNLYYVPSTDERFDSKVSLGDGTQAAEFSNYDENYSLSLAGYAVNFYTNAPIGKQCLVDPKIFKKLEGRALQPGEFSFKLIEVNNYRDLVPTGFSVTATNDEYGMVDFDKAGVIGYDEDGNPCCLSFTAPGTYTYIVEEAPGYQRDPSITYDETTYTFTAVVEDVDGVLKNTAMYYGVLGEDGQNTEIEGSREDPSFHPTLTNEARPMDLRVRKTSAEGRDQQTGLGTDTGEGLNGAVYGLYMVNEGGSYNDIFLGQATSEPTMVLVDGEYIEQDGWNTFKDVNLTEDNLYYFKEISAPDEHTVDPFRSMYFKLAVERDGDGNPLSYGLAYTDARSTAADGVLYAQGDDARVTPATDEGDRMVLTYDNGSGLGSGGVFDQTTSVGFSKRDTHTQNWVSGAKLQLLTEDETVVAEWVTGDSVYQVDKTLNVNQKYILRELEAPAGYDKAADVVFHMDDYGALVLDSGQSKDQLRNCEVNGTQLTMYDVMIDAELVEQQTRENVIPTTWSDSLPKMGDSILVGLFIGIAGAFVVGFVGHRLRRRTEED